MAVSRKAFSSALTKSLKFGVRPSYAEVKKLQKQVGIYGAKVTDAQVKQTFRTLKEKGLLGAKAQSAGEYGFKTLIKKEAESAGAAVEAEQKKAAHTKVALRERLMTEQKTKERIAEALSGPAQERKKDAGKEAARAAAPLAPSRLPGIPSAAPTAPARPASVVVPQTAEEKETAVPPPVPAAERTAPPPESKKEEPPLPDMFGGEE
ncbi:hypothetical protein EPN90_04570 [Patescibacteria group bacterium]|nr:MAG: hypothetical protein EPN90_04570 [Patescibacteria group bacterium]